MKFEFCVDKPFDKERLDIFLVNKLQPIKPELSRKKIQDLIENGFVALLNPQNPKQKILPSQKINFNENYLIEITQSKPNELTAQEINFEVIFEDEHLLIINKPHNLTVHPGPGNHDQTLANGLLYRFQNNLSSINGDFRPGIVHRLDKDTSGLIVVAKNDLTHQLLSKMLEQHKIERYYLAFIYGVINPQNGRIDKKITRSPKNRLKMTTSRTKGRNAITNYKTIEIFADNFASLVECKLETGRTHQIRVHFESEKHSLIGDQLYSSCKKQPLINFNHQAIEFIKNFSRQALHSYKIGFTHPITKKTISFSIDLPLDLQELCQNLKKLS